jgi:hypothetical protein
MAAADRIIDATFLGLMGLSSSDGLYNALNGITILQAIEYLEDLLPLVLAVDAASRGTVQSYSVNGRTVAVSAELVERSLRILRDRLNYANGGGPQTLRVCL